MILPEYSKFKNNPSPENAMEFGLAITKQAGIIQEKKDIFKLAFVYAGHNEKTEAILNMWAVASMLEDDLEIVQIVQGVRGFLGDPQLTPEMIEDWAYCVYDAKRCPEDILDFIAIDLRNHPGVSKDLRRRLGHPSP